MVHALPTVPTYPLAPQGVFWTIQGEGALLGTPMVFVRLAGCSVGCAGCDTDYGVRERLALPDLLARVKEAAGEAEWAWVTGGEPTDHDLDPLVEGLQDMGLRVALATAGTKQARRGSAWGGVDFLSVSPHDPLRWQQRSGDQLNLVPGLGGLSLTDPALLVMLDGCERDFGRRYVTPLADADGRPANLAECLAFVRARPGWSLGMQAHKAWGLP